ncbi:MAG: cytochrome c biogenesis protein CcdA [Candidatus Saccharibacteria bacterium]|nr:cytochrome c biogenesis protein CcdA [Candidatus Saccharibacteria bacterium]
MELYIAAFAAGILTLLAPCILPLLPVVLGASVVSDDETKKRDPIKPIVITVSLGVSIIAFTLLLKGSSVLLGVPAAFWAVVAGAIIVLLGLTFALPVTWEKLTAKLNLTGKTQSLLGKSSRLSGQSKNVATGLALGPVFNSCSPTYLFIVAAVLPATFLKGFGLLVAYTIGLCGTLLLIAFAGQSFTRKLGVLSDPHGTFKRVIGIILIIVGLAIVFGLDKDIQTFVLDKGWYDPVADLEMSLD